MECEHCSCSHDGSYGSGRFCQEKCSRAASTARNRKEINRKVSASLKHFFAESGQLPATAFKKGHVPWHKGMTFRLPIEEFRDYDDVPPKRRREFIIWQQAGKCSECKCEQVWNDKPLAFHLDHVNGCKTDNRRENLRALCPNCHSQTPTYSGRNVRLRRLGGTDTSMVP